MSNNSWQPTRNIIVHKYPNQMRKFWTPLENFFPFLSSNSVWRVNVVLSKMIAEIMYYICCFCQHAIILWFNLFERITMITRSQWCKKFSNRFFSSNEVGWAKWDQNNNLSLGVIKRINSGKLCWPALSTTIWLIK